MMLANRELRVVLVSIHVALRAAIAAVTPGNVLQTLRITDAALTPVLGRRPRIAVAGLNPHAGEGGLFGPEETDAIAPAIAAARGEGIDATGPLPPDTVFMRARQGAFDVVVAMYHDQGLIPVKYLGLDHGVNVTLGLPLVRTSPTWHRVRYRGHRAGRPIQPRRGHRHGPPAGGRRLSRRYFRYFFRLSRMSRSSSTSSGVTGGAGGAAGVSRLSRLICFTMMKMMKARMAKFTATVMKLP